MSFEITVDTSGADALLDSTTDAVANVADGLLQAVDDVALPDVISVSQSVWGVDTGEYSSSWTAAAIGSDTVEISNDTEYASALEYGWTLKNGSEISSPGVLMPTVNDDLDSIAAELESWLASQSQ